MSHMTSQKIVEKFEAAQNALVLQASDLSLETIAAMVDSAAIDVSPRYQRRDRWTGEAQAELIESFLLNVPVPPVYLAEDDFGTYSVIDGKQRITAIHRFMREAFSLEGVKKFKEVEGLKFSNLPKQLQNALNIRPYVRVVTLLKQTDPQLKYEVFTRLNTGGEPLNAQEIRNALYRGAFNDILFSLSEDEFLRQQLKIKTNKETPYSEMQDVEAVLRFLCLSETWQQFEGDMRRSLDSYAAAHQLASKQKQTILRTRFAEAISRCEAIWGSNAFRRFEKGTMRDQFMSAMYDAQMIAMSELSATQYKKIETRKAAFLVGFMGLFKDQKFVDAIRVSTNSPSKVVYRITKIKELMAKFS
ncbi:MAG: DUF262 domain-containing protein [Mitsuaria chitosanitabida]|uniref:DUF262 domain-containing protein n=1 Tax=Roseateles chitosanitabidus TaxID=65048 RepID=UPI001B2902C1|nr:DUF262 domain-containing protein [Roseateles chitosanitabidus]MBO9689986.1 DUF262 domain-containing protein [Roseateles chitosanitabidus]